MITHRAEIITQINNLFEDAFEIPPEKLLPHQDIYQDLGLDSIDAFDVAAAFEDRFALGIDTQTLSQIRTLEQIYDLLEAHKEKIDFSIEENL